MATLTSPSSSLAPAIPYRSSPLAASTGISSSSAPRPLPKRNVSFPISRPLRPFASIANSLQQTKPLEARRSLDSAERPSEFSVPKSKGIKIIEPSKNYPGGFFVLNLSQAELSRRE